MIEESFYIALNSIKGNRLRSILTIMMFVVGITALVGVMTAVNSVKKEISRSFGKFGACSFYFKPSGKGSKMIMYHEAEEFRSAFSDNGTVSVFALVPGVGEISSDRVSMPPNVALLAADANYLQFAGGDIVDGRNFTRQEVEKGEQVCLIGENIAGTLFGTTSPVGEYVTCSCGRFRVVGLSDLENIVAITINSARALSPSLQNSVIIGVSPFEGTSPDQIVEKGRIIFRSIRGLTPSEEDDFQIKRDDSSYMKMIDMMGTVMVVAVILGIITISGAVVGLINMMFVSVSERVREIGVRRSMGATQREIHLQFVMEAVLLGLIGGVAGVLCGVLCGGVVSKFMEVTFSPPWGWIVIALLLSFTTSLIAGWSPAKRGASIPPVEALNGLS